MNTTYDHGYDDDAVAEYDESVHCYLCFLYENERVDDSPKADQGPLRPVVRRSISKGSDPYEVLHLSCGHAII